MTRSAAVTDCAPRDNMYPQEAEMCGKNQTLR
jgi:hypothetical protein